LKAIHHLKKVLMKSNTIGGFFALSLLAFGALSGSVFADEAQQAKPAAQNWSRERLDTTVGATTSVKANTAE
jgi:hypothetical protein